jgi:predicted RNA-binding protein
MLRRSIAGGLGLAMLCMALVASAADKSKDKDVKKDGKEVKGEITKIDKDKMTFKVKTEDGKTAEYKVEEATKFLGPKGGESKEGVKDDRFVVGAAVTLVLSKNGKTLEEVHLPLRSDLPAKDKAKDKPKTKDKPKEKDK